jgi:hypothetical protein
LYQKNIQSEFSLAPRSDSLILFSLGPMKAILLAISLLAASPSPSPPQIPPRFLVGEWRSENEGGTYHFRANGTYYWHSFDVGDEGRWRLRDGHTLELVSPGVSGKGSRQIIMIDRVVHETLYVRVEYQRAYQREVWLKQYGP